MARSVASAEAAQGLAVALDAIAFGVRLLGTFDAATAVDAAGASQLAARLEQLCADLRRECAAISDIATRGGSDALGESGLFCDASGRELVNRDADALRAVDSTPLPKLGGPAPFDPGAAPGAAQDDAPHEARILRAKTSFHSVVLPREAPLADYSHGLVRRTRDDTSEPDDDAGSDAEADDDEPDAESDAARHDAAASTRASAAVEPRKRRPTVAVVKPSSRGAAPRRPPTSRRGADGSKSDGRAAADCVEADVEAGDALAASGDLARAAAAAGQRQRTLRRKYSLRADVRPSFAFRLFGAVAKVAVGLPEHVDDCAGDGKPLQCDASTGAEFAPRKRTMDVLLSRLDTALLAPQSAPRASVARGLYCHAVCGLAMHALAAGVLVAHIYVMAMAPVLAAFRVHGAASLALVNVLVEALCLAGFRRLRDDEAAAAAKSGPRAPLRRAALLLLAHLPTWTLEALCLLLPQSTPYGVGALSRVVKLILAVKLLHRNLVLFDSRGASYPVMALLGLDPAYVRICKLVGLFLTALHYASCAYHAVAQHHSSKYDKSLSATGLGGRTTGRRIPARERRTWTRTCAAIATLCCSSGSIRTTGPASPSWATTTCLRRRCKSSSPWRCLSSAWP
ncbi:hypothetical protein M885DRAFT_169791 [Pelagophyceae sp. CCMP2097]|nr:hypothetical protein M885DRAFT_169791 [Pelagophyceae sp. CCMP2097]